MKQALEELVKLTQSVFSNLSKINGKNYSKFSTNSWQLCIYFTTGEIHTVINNTLANLGSLALVEHKIKKNWETASNVLSKKHPGILAEIHLPEIALDNDSNRDLWVEFSSHITQSQNALSNFLSKDEFYNQAQLQFGDKGQWFSELYENLKSVYAYDLKESEKLFKSYQVFFNQLDAKNLSYAGMLKNLLGKHEDLYKERLADLKQNLDAFKVINDSFEEIMELAHKNSL